MPPVPMVSIAVGAFALFIVCLLPVRENTGRRLAFTGLLLGVAGTLAGVQLLLWMGDYVLNCDDERLIRNQITPIQIASRAGHVPKNLLIIEGSSQTAEDLDGVTIQRQLSDQGYDVLVVQLAIPGANNLERYEMVRRFAYEMHRHQLRYGQNTQLLVELHEGYETNPIALFSRDQDTLRGYFYSTFTNLAVALETYRQIDARPDRQTLGLLKDMLSEAVAQSLSIGLLPDMERFDWLTGLPVIGSNSDPWEKYTFKPYDPEAPARADAIREVQTPFAVTAARAGRLRGAFDGAINQVGFFYLPATDLKMMLYGHAFCQRSVTSPCLDAYSPGLYAALDSKPYWFDEHHLTTRGAQIYSRYFAQLLVAERVVVR